MLLLKLATDLTGRVRTALEVRGDPAGWARRQGVTVGEHSRFLAISSATFGSEPYLISLGDHVTVTSGVQFITHDGGVWVMRGEHPEVDVFGPISVGDNVFIGHSAMIMPGVTVGDNVVIGARSVVTKDIPSDSVAVGVPARVVSSYDDYVRRSLAKSLPTKGMGPEDKRAYLERHFGLA